MAESIYTALTQLGAPSAIPDNPGNSFRKLRSGGLITERAIGFASVCNDQNATGTTAGGSLTAAGSHLR